MQSKYKQDDIPKRLQGCFVGGGMTPMEAAMISGAMGAMTNKEDPLRGAAMGAAMGYGGSQLFGGATPGATPPVPAAAPTMSPVQSGWLQAAQDAAQVGGQSAAALPAAMSPAQPGWLQTAQGAAQAGGQGAAAVPTPTQQPGMFDNLKANTWDKMGTMGKVATAGMGASLASSVLTPEQEEEERKKNAMHNTRFSFDTFRPSLAPRFAVGGIASLQPQQQLPPIQVPSVPSYQSQQMPQAFNRGGITSLGSYSDGGQLLQGPGTGLSDDIPAMIGGNQPAQLADGEFVVPADVVSGMGAGSTDAGARQLYAMMDRVRQQAHGSKQQIRNVNPSKVMPA